MSVFDPLVSTVKRGTPFQFWDTVVCKVNSNSFQSLERKDQKINLIMNNLIIKFIQYSYKVFNNGESTYLSLRLSLCGLNPVSFQQTLKYFS